MKRTTAMTMMTEIPSVSAMNDASQSELVSRATCRTAFLIYLYSHTKASSVPEDCVPSTSKKQPTKPSTKFKNPTGNPSAVNFERLGIKVKDFAYAKTNLRPVKTIYRHPRQVQPSLPTSQRPLQRQSTDPDSSQPQSQGLYRTPTEPALPATSPAPEAELEGNGQRESLSQRLQPAFNMLGSQYSEMSALTPISTPNTSQKWDIENTSRKKTQADLTTFAHTSPLTPLPSSPASTAPSHASQSSHRQASRRHGSVVVPKLSARYFLRKRTSPSSPSSVKPAKRSRSMIATADPSVKQLSRAAVSIQSSHSQSKTKDVTASPKPVTPRRRAVGARGKRKSVV